MSNGREMIEMTDEEIKELRNDLVLLSVAIDQMEKRMRKGLFTNALTIIEEQRDIVNKYNPLCQSIDDGWLMIKRSDYTSLLNEVTSLGLKLGPEMYVPGSIGTILHIIYNCFHTQGDIE